MNYSGMCIDCKKVNTTSKNENGDFVCVCCSNDRYYKDLQYGTRVELKLNLKEYSQGTLEEIKMVLAKNKI